jgi:hypothetical protein
MDLAVPIASATCLVLPLHMQRTSARQRDGQGSRSDSVYREPAPKKNINQYRGPPTNIEVKVMRAKGSSRKAECRSRITTTARTENIAV